MSHPSQQALGGDVGSIKPARVEDTVTSNMYVFRTAPDNAVGANGQWAIRVDSTVAGARLYQKISGVWTALTP